MRRLINPSVAIVVALLLSGAARAGCIDVGGSPYTIRAPGKYCVTAMLVAEGNGITIAADDVHLDCRGYTIDGTTQSASTTKRGIVGYNRAGVTIRDCRIKGFFEGIRLTGDDNDVRDNVLIAPLSRGIVVQGTGNNVQDNRVSDVGGTANVGWGAFGILVDGPSTILGNVVSGVHASAGSGERAYGIYSVRNDAGLIRANTVRNVLGDVGQLGMALTAYDGTHVVLKENILLTRAGAYAFGLLCTGAGSVSYGNVFHGFDVGFSAGCTKASPQ
jgi:hypothetical protein